MSWRTVLTVSSSATGICIVQAFAHSDQRFWPYLTFVFALLTGTSYLRLTGR